MLKVRVHRGGEQDYSVQVMIKIVNNSAICDARYINIRRTGYRAPLCLRRARTLSFVGIV